MFFHFHCHIYREVQLDFTPEIEVLHIYYTSCLRDVVIKNREISLKQYMKYLNFRSKIQLDHLEHSNGKMKQWLIGRMAWLQEKGPRKPSQSKCVIHVNRAELNFILPKEL